MHLGYRDTHRAIVGLTAITVGEIEPHDASARKWLREFTAVGYSPQHFADAISRGVLIKQKHSSRDRSSNR